MTIQPDGDHTGLKGKEINLTGKTVQEHFDEARKQLDDIDAKLDAASDSPSAGKIATVNAWIKENEGKVVPFTSTVVSKLKEIDDAALLAAVYTATVRELNEHFKETVSNTLEAAVKANPPAEVVKLSDEQLKELQELRRNVAQKAKLVRDLLIASGEGTDEDLPKIKTRMGAKGKRGARAISGFDLFIDGDALTGSDNTLTYVYKEAGYEKKADLTAAMQEAGIPTREMPDDEYSFELKNGKTLTLVRRDKEEDEDEEEEEGESSEDNSVE